MCNYREREKRVEAAATAGTLLRCHRDCDYFLTKGKVYTAIEVTAPQSTDVGFTFPAYVYLHDDRGKVACAHLSRFDLATASEAPYV